MRFRILKTTGHEPYAATSKGLFYGTSGVAVLLVMAAAWIAPASHAAGKGQNRPEREVFSAPLPNVPGKSLTAVIVAYGPGETSPPHHHAGSVFAYVLSGSIRSENSATGPAKVYQHGDAFFEPPGSEHLVSENASAKEPASLLAVFVADDGVPLTSTTK